MARNTDEKARGLTPVRNGKAAGANPAESILTFTRRQDTNPIVVAVCPYISIKNQIFINM